MLRWLKFPTSKARATGRLGPAAPDTKNIHTLCNEQPSRLNVNKSRYHQASQGDLFKNGRYMAVKGLGQGKYSHVWVARDLQTQCYVALKILTADCYGTAHDVFEIELLQDVLKHQSHLESRGGSHVINMLDTFQHKGANSTHECIVTPVLGSDLYTHARRFPENRIPVLSMKKITKQILEGLDFLHRECSIIHTGMVSFANAFRRWRESRGITDMAKDLKPSNILFQLENTQETIEKSIQDRSTPPKDITQLHTPLVNEMKDMQLKIIDLGVSCWVDKRLSNSIQPEHLRAPEIILGAPWGTAVDIWSLGCVVIELVKGHIAFPGSAHPKGRWTSEDDHLAQYMEVLGPMPHELLLRGSKTKDFFDDKGHLLRIPKLQWTSLEAHMDGDRDPMRRPSDMSKEEVPVFVDLVREMLSLDPDHRKPAGELLRHPWLNVE